MYRDPSGSSCLELGGLPLFIPGTDCRGRAARSVQRRAAHFRDRTHRASPNNHANEMNYYRRYVGDYLRDTARLSMLEHGAYNLLLDYYYGDERPLPLDKAELYSIVRAMNAADQKAVDKVLRLYFIAQADGFHQKRVDHEILASQTARINGKSGGRRGKNQGISEITGMQTGTVTGRLTGTVTGMETGTVTERQSQNVTGRLTGTVTGTDSTEGKQPKKRTKTAADEKPDGKPEGKAKPNRNGNRNGTSSNHQPLKPTPITKSISSNEGLSVKHRAPVDNSKNLRAQKSNSKPQPDLKAQWWRSNAGIEETARALHLNPKPGETHVELKQRCFAKIHPKEAQHAP
jgi:uncharacterized protein YdaU (DUF1376 family)